MTDAYIFDAVRTPRGKGKKDGSLHEVTSLALSARVLNELKDRTNLPTEQVEDVIWGCVTPVGEQGGDIARSAVLYAGWDESVPGVQVNRFCASGLEAFNLAANQVRGGAGDLYVAGGVEMMGRVPMGSDGFAIGIDPYVAFNAYIAPQGIGADVIATKWGFSRDDVDAYAVESQKRAAAAWDEGRFGKSVMTVKDQNGIPILDRDEHMRPGTDMQSLGGLKASFQGIGEGMPGFDAVAIMRYPELEKVNHVHHAGNSSGICDGAAAILVGTKEAGERLGLKPRARVRATAKVGSEPSIMLTGPIPATKKVLKAAGMEIGDIDLHEVNEAFAAIPMMYMDEFGVDHSVTNVNGGAIAMGHPLGATGAMILGTVLDELERTDKETALTTLCIGVGMGAATVIERV